MKRFYFVFSLLFSIMANATTIEDLRTAFSPLTVFAKEKFDRAQKMAVQEFQKGAPITFQECQTLQNKIRETSKVDPFEFHYDHGSFSHYLCGYAERTNSLYLLNASGKTSFGLNFNYVIQREGNEFWNNQISHYLVDSQNRIVEIQDLSNSKSTHQLVEYTVTSLDPSGDVYISHFAKDFSVANTDIRGVKRMEQFISHDGSHPFPLLRNTITNPIDSSKDYQVLSLYQANSRDWNSYELPITHAWGNGFYFYPSNSVVTLPHSFQAFTVKYRGGKEHCATGYLRTETASEDVPQGQAYYDCLNY